MPVSNQEIADLLSRLADLTEIGGGDPFRIRAYRNAAREIGATSERLADLVDAGADLSKRPGIGKAIAEKIAVIVETGELPQLVELEQRVPRALAELMKIPGLGPKRVKAVYDELEIRSAEDLARALRTHRIRALPGFGDKTERLIAAGLERVSGRERRIRLADAEALAAPLLDYLGEVPGVKQLVVGGSFRRRCETVGDLDILCCCRRGTPVVERLVAYEAVAEIVSQGTTRSTVRLRNDLQVDLRVVPEVSFGAALQYFTGSKAHNIATRKIAVSKGWKLNEYGLFKGKRRIAGRSERDVYKALGLPLIPPELREDRGEIEAARKRRLPDLVKPEDLRGDLHCHTDASDGRDSLAAMARSAAERGYQYLAVSDHSRRVSIAHGLDPKHLRAQIDAIDRLNERLEGLVLLKSCEVEILEDGKLDLPDSLLERLDLSVCAVHYRFDFPRKRQTERILRAMDNLHFNILAHPSGRLINERPAYEVDLERLMEAAVERGCIMEVNAQPARLDLGDLACHAAKQCGLKIAVSSDAHSTEQLGLVRFGIAQARRGWLEPADVVNTLPLRKLRALLRR